MAVSGCPRIFFLIFNGLFWLLGLFILGYIFWTIGTNPTLRSGFGAGTTQFTYTILCVGFYIVATGLIGTIGAVRESTCLLKTYIILMVFFILAEIAGALLGYFLRNNLQPYRESVWNDFNSDTKNFFQGQMKCCGFYTYSEYTDTISDLHESCFVPSTAKSGVNLYTTGCWSKFIAWFNTYVWIAIVVPVVVIELLCLILAIVMLVRILRAKRVWSRFLSSTVATTGRKRRHRGVYDRDLYDHRSRRHRRVADYDSYSTRAFDGSDVGKPEHYQPYNTYSSATPTDVIINNRRRARDINLFAKSSNVRSYDLNERRKSNLRNDSPVSRYSQGFYKKEINVTSAGHGFDDDYIRQYKPY